MYFFMSFTQESKEGEKSQKTNMIFFFTKNYSIVFGIKGIASQSCCPSTWPIQSFSC